MRVNLLGRKLRWTCINSYKLASSRAISQSQSNTAKNPTKPYKKNSISVFLPFVLFWNLSHPKPRRSIGTHNCIWVLLSPSTIPPMTLASINHNATPTILLWPATNHVCKAHNRKPATYKRTNHTLLICKQLKPRGVVHWTLDCLHTL